MIQRKPGGVTVDDALQHYFRLVAQGQVPDREAFCLEYPDLASELLRRLSDIEFLNSMGGMARPPLKHLGYGVGTFNLSAPPDKLPKSPPAIPELGGYQLIAEIGRGQQGYIYKARQRGTRRIVAVKVIREGSFASAAERQRFENEVQLASRLSHPHLVSVYEYGQDAGRDYYAMEFIEGVALDQHCDAKLLSLRQIAELFVRVCDGVGYAHEHGVLHRDLKPTNILVDDSGKPHVLDFGLAKAVGNDALPQVTQVGEFAGTWVYASPEQVRRDPSLLDVRSDVYSLGVILYELVTGCLPYRLKDRSREAVAEAILNQDPRPPTQIVRDLDRDLETIILRTLQKDSTRRYASATALADDLRRYLCGDPIEARRDETWYVLGRMLRRHRWKVAAFAGSFVVLVLFSIAISVLLSQTLTAKSEAVAAFQTTGQRLSLAQDSKPFTVTMVDMILDKLNAYNAIADASPHLTSISYLHKPKSAGLIEVLEYLIPDLYKWWDTDGPDRIDFLKPKFEEWLDRHDAAHKVAVAFLEHQRAEFKTEGTLDSLGVFRQIPRNLHLGEHWAMELSFRAVWLAARSEFPESLRSLNAARELVWSLDAGRTRAHRSLSFAMQSYLYSATCRVLEMNPTNLGDWERWLADDAPPATMELCILLDYETCTSALAAATLVDPKTVEAYLDIHAIDKITENPRPCEKSKCPSHSKQRVSPKEGKLLIDIFFRRLHEAESLSHALRESWAREVEDGLKSNPSFDILRPVLPAYKSVFQARGQTRTWRAATRVALRLCQYRRQEGHWPGTLADLRRRFCDVVFLDPHLGVSLGYHLVDGQPVLYSLNEDETDDLGNQGNWGEPGTDVVFFKPIR